MKLQLITCCALALLLTACGSSEDTPVQKPVTDSIEKPLAISAVNYPLAWAAGQLAGDTAGVSFSAPADIDPAFW